MKKNNIIALILIFFCLQIQSVASTIKFAQISDLHYQSNILRTSINYYALPIIDDVANEINKDENIMFTLITGDIINKRKYDDAKFIYKHFNEIFKKPWYSVFGNHDLGGRILFKIKLINLLKEINLLFRSITKDYYYFRPVPDVVFVGLNSNYTFKRTPLGYISKRQLSFLEDIFKNMKRTDVVVIFMHHTPIKLPFVHKNHYIVNEEKFMEILRSSKLPILLLGGHYHTCKIERENNILKVATPSLASFPLAFRVIEIKNNEYKVIFKFDYREVNQELQKNIVQKIKVGTIPAKFGNDEDRKTVIEIVK